MSPAEKHQVPKPERGITAGAKVRIVIESTIESIDSGDMRLSNGVQLYQYDLAQMTCTMQQPGWQPGDIANDGHTDLWRVCRPDGVHLWQRPDGRPVYDDETSLASLTVVSRAWEADQASADAHQESEPELELTDVQKAYNVAQYEMFQLAAYGHHRYAPLVDRMGKYLTIQQIEAGQRDYNQRLRTAREELEAATLRLVAEHAETIRGDWGPVAAWLRSLADDPAELSLLAVHPDERDGSDQLLTQRARLIASTHLTEDTLRERAQAFQLYPEHMDIWRTVEGIDYLLADDQEASQ